MDGNAFELLSLSPCLVLGEDKLQEAFRMAGKEVHPDAGGNQEEFESLRAAREVLESPARRLKHWLDLREVEVETRGVVDAGLMDVFSLVGEVTQRANDCTRKRSAAQSALGLALLESETQQCMEAVEAAIVRVDQSIEAETRSFPAIEQAELADPVLLARIVRNLLFLEKWKQTLRALMPQLV